jgi:hypothetical protein
MTRLLATTALLGALLAAPAWSQMTTKTHHRAPHAVHHAASTEASGTSTAPRPQHRIVGGDDSAEMLNRQMLQNLQKGG